MNPTRKTKIDDLAVAKEARERQTTMSADDRYKQKLADLREFVRQLAKTDVGRADIHRRLRTFGAVRIVAGESDRDRYGKLRRWLDRELAPIKESQLV